MNSETARHAAIGAAATALTPVAIGLHVGLAAWRNPLLGPLRRPTESAIEAAAVRGERVERQMRAMATGAAERQLIVVLNDPALDRIIDRAFASKLVAIIGEQVRTSEELMRTVQAIAESDAVRSALTAQSSGLAREVQGELRTRTASVDDVIENTARRFLRRPRSRSAAVVVPDTT
jgi:hypothetical protein